MDASRERNAGVRKLLTVRITASGRQTAISNGLIVVFGDG